MAYNVILTQVATVTVAQGCIAAAAKIDLSYSPGGANVHSYPVLGYLGPHEFSRFEGRTLVPNTRTFAHSIIVNIILFA